MRGVLDGPGRVSELSGVLLACGRPRGIWGWLWFSCGVAHCVGGFIAIFRGFLGSIGGILTLAGEMGARLSIFGVWVLSKYFLIR